MVGKDGQEIICPDLVHALIFIFDQLVAAIDINVVPGAAVQRVKTLAPVEQVVTAMAVERVLAS